MQEGRHTHAGGLGGSREARLVPDASSWPLKQNWRMHWPGAALAQGRSCAAQESSQVGAWLGLPMADSRSLEMQGTDQDAVEIA